MRFGGYILADFCKINGERFCFVNGQEKHEYRCVKHGYQPLIRYYGFARSNVLWACPKCIEAHLEGELVEASDLVKEEAESVPRKCGACDALDNLQDCDICGAACCPTHRLESVCTECADAIDRQYGTLYAGL